MDRGTLFRISSYSLLFIVLFCAQYLYFGVYNFDKLILVMIQISTAYLIIILLAEEFWELYVKTLFVICLVSLLFYLLCFIPSVENLLMNMAFVHPNSTLSGRPLRNLVVYNFNFGGVEDLYKRNSGPFWEPGAFAGYILIAVYANFFILRQRMGRLYLFVITLISTFSTMGLFALIFLIWAKFGRKLSLKQISVIVGIIGVLLLVPREMTFDKVAKKMELTTGKYQTKTRFASAYLDIVDLMKYPLLGRGFVNESRYDGLVEYNNRNCGVTDQLVRLGIPVGVIFFYLFYRVFKVDSINSPHVSRGLIGLILLLIIGFSEMYFRFLFFWVLNVKGVLYVWNSRYSR